MSSPPRNSPSTQPKPPSKWRKRLLRTLLALILLPSLGLLGLYTLFLFPGVQNWTAMRASAWASNRSGTEVSIEKVRLRFMRKFAFGEVYVEDYNGDTLLYTRELVARVEQFDPFQRHIVIQHVRIRGAQFTMRKEFGEREFSFSEFVRRLSGQDEVEEPVEVVIIPPVMDTAMVENDQADSMAIEESPGSDKLFEGDAEDEKSKAWQLVLGDVELDDGRFHIRDNNARTSMDFIIPKIRMLMRRTSPSNRILQASSILIEGLDVRQVRQDSVRGPSFRTPVDSPRLNTQGWVYGADELRLKNCSFSLNDMRKAPMEGMDYSHMDIDNINFVAHNAVFKTDTILASIQRMEARDHSGAEIEKLSGDFLLTPRVASLKDLVLETPKSRISDSLSMEYGTFNAFKNFETEVVLNAWLDNTQISMDDLALFVPGADVLNGKVVLNGHLYGRISNLRGRDLDLRFGRNSRLLGRFDVNGLPDPNESFVEFQLEELKTTMAEVKALMPGLSLPSSLHHLGSIQASGEFIGFTRDFVAFGQVNTAIGSVKSDLNLKVEPEREQVTYSGTLDLVDFDLGVWTQQPEWLGAATVRSSVQGTGNSVGFGLANLDALLQANVASLFLRGYQYTNLEFDGRMQEGFFEGSLESADPNFDQTFEGTIDFREDSPVFAFRSDVRNLNFYALGLSPDSLSMQGNLSLDLVGDNIDSILGLGGVYNLRLQDADREYSLDTLELRATEEGGQRSLVLESDIFMASFEGDFVLSRLPDAIRLMLNDYFPRADFALDVPVPDQDLRFNIEIEDSRNFLQLFDPKLGQVENVAIWGELFSEERYFELRASLPLVSYGDIRAEEWVIDLHTDEKTLQLFTRSQRIWIGDSLHSPVSVLEADYKNDSLFFQVMLGRDTDPDRLNLLGVMTAAEQQLMFRILPSEIYTQYERWDISENNSMVYDYQSITVSDFTIQSGEQIVTLSSIEKEGYESWLDIDLQTVNAGNILSAFNINPMKLGGLLSGRVSASNVTSNLGFASNLQLKDFSLDELKLGVLDLNASLQKPENRLNFILGLSGQSDVRARGHIGLNEGASLEADMRLYRLPLAPMGFYLQGLFDQLEGDISGQVKLRGSASNPELSGQLKVEQGGLRLIYLNTRYLFPELEVSMVPGRIVIAPGILYDEEGNTGNLSGAVSYSSLSNWRFENINITTDHMRFMKTDRFSNPEFYGSAYGSGSVSINGPLNDIAITILARSNRNTSIVIPITYGPSVGQGNFISFRQPVDENNKTPVVQERNPGRVRFDFYIEATEDAEVALDLLGDRLSARGQGNLHLEISTLGDFAMNGVYRVSQGQYTFSLQDLVSKDFRITDGSTITWTGDPYQAQLDIDAVYSTRASEWDLVSNFVSTMSAQEIERARQLQQVDVYLSLSGSLEAPDISFDIKIPQGQSGGTSVFERRLQEIRADENELNKQVFGLLVVNRFIPDQSGISPFLSGAGNSVSEFLTNQLSVYVTDWVSDFLITDVDVDISYRNYQSAQAELTQQELQIELSKRFMDDRVFVNVGGNIGLNQPGEGGAITGRNNNVAGDFEIQYAITADGRFRIKAFQRPDYDIIAGRNISETGVGLFYSQEFDSVFDLFKRAESPEPGDLRKQED